MENNSTYINGYLNDVLIDYLKNMDDFMLVAKIIAGLGMLVSMYFTFFQMMDSGSNEGMSKFLKKFMLIYLGIFYYDTFIKIINLPLDAITNVTREVAIKDITDANKIAKYDELKMLDAEVDPELESEVAKLVKESRGDLNQETDDESLTESIISGITKTGNIFANAITTFFTDTLILIAELALIILNVVRGFYLIVLTLFGIFVMAISSFPTLEGSFSQWLMKYINVYLWLAIGFILQGILSRIELMNQLKPLDEYNVGNSSFSILISLCTIIGFLMIPSMSSWMINAATSNLSNKMQSKGESTSQQVAKAAKTLATGNPISIPKV